MILKFFRKKRAALAGALVAAFTQSALASYTPPTTDFSLTVRGLDDTPCPGCGSKEGDRAGDQKTWDIAVRKGDMVYGISTGVYTAPLADRFVNTQSRWKKTLDTAHFGVVVGRENIGLPQTGLMRWSVYGEAGALNGPVSEAWDKVNLFVHKNFFGTTGNRRSPASTPAQIYAQASVRGDARLYDAALNDRFNAAFDAAVFGSAGTLHSDIGAGGFFSLRTAKAAFKPDLPTMTPVANTGSAIYAGAIVQAVGHDRRFPDGLRNPFRAAVLAGVQYDMGKFGMVAVDARIPLNSVTRGRAKRDTVVWGLRLTKTF